MKQRPPVAQTTTWLTPPALLRALGGFDLDPCACPLPRPWVTAATMWTREDEPLSRPWHGRVWLNPPFSPQRTQEAFLTKMAAHGSGTALLFARTETEMFHRLVWERALGLLFLRGRPHFHHQDGARGAGNSGAPVVLAAYSPIDVAILRECGLEGRLVEL